MNRLSAVLLVATTPLLTMCSNGSTPSDQPGVSAAQQAKNDALRTALEPSCAACHGAGTNRPFFASAAAFNDQLVYNTAYVVPGNPDGSELIRLLNGMGTTFKQMPLNGAAFATLAASGMTKISMDEVRSFIQTLEARAGTSTGPDPTATTMRRVSGPQLQRALYDQLGLVVTDFFMGFGANQDLVPMRDPDGPVSQQEAGGSYSYAREHWLGVGGSNNLNRVAASVEPSAAFMQNVTQISQRWCSLSVAKSGSPLFKFAKPTDTMTSNPAAVQQNLGFLYYRMLGLPATDAETAKLAALFRAYEPSGAATAWTSVCAALIRHPLWLSY